MATAGERELFTRKPREIWFQTFELYHPQMGLRRFVLGQQVAKTFTLESGAPRDGGQAVSFEPAGGTITEVVQSNNPVTGIDLQLGRVGQRIKQELARIEGTGWLQSVEFIYRTYRSSNTTAPLNVPVRLVVSNVNMNHDSVSLTCEDDNPGGVTVARKYLAEDFPGLATEL